MGLLDFFKGKTSSVDSDTLVEADVCPNCWGKQEWDGKFKEFVADRSKDIINKDATAQQGFIQKFVTENITGIQLKNEGSIKSCPTCKASFNH